MKTECILPNGIDLEDYRKFHPKCEMCDGQISITSAVSSGELWRDNKGKLYLSFIKDSADTGLISFEKGFAVSSENVCWPITRLPEGTKLIIEQKKEGL